MVKTVSKTRFKGKVKIEPVEMDLTSDIRAFEGSNPSSCIYLPTSGKGREKVRFNYLYSDLQQQAYLLKDHQLAKLSRLINRIREERFRGPRKNKSKYINRAFSDEELRALFLALPDERYRLMFALQLALSLRVGELSALNIGQLDLFKQEIIVHQTKTGLITPKHIPQDLFQRLIAYIDQHKEEIKAHQGFLWFSDGATGKKKTNHLAPDYLRTVFREARERAGLTKVYDVSRDGRRLFVFGTHSFKRSGITRMADALGGNPFKLKAYSGHASIKSLETYVQPYNREQLNGTIDSVFSSEPTADRLKRFFG